MLVIRCVDQVRALAAGRTSRHSPGDGGGYTALLFSINGAVRSMGLTAALGEIATQLSAMLVLPAALYYAARNRAARSSHEQPFRV